MTDNPQHDADSKGRGFYQRNLRDFFGRWLTLLIVSLSGSMATAQAELDEAAALCKNMTPENRAMAIAAGYNVDKVCRRIRGGASVLTMPETVPTPLVLPRDNRNGDDVTADTPVVLADKRDTSLMSVTAGNPQLVSDAVKTAPAPRLEPFGYALFAGEPTTFEPTTQTPIPADYLLGPGDSVQVLFYGKLNDTYELQINRDGTVDFPELGPVTLSGLRFAEAKQLINERVAQQMIGVRASITLGQLRSVQVFLLGEAYQPGAYTVSALSTITNALFLSGGLNDIASLRNIQLKRAGAVIATLDLYDLLLKGDTSDDERLQAGDVIFIPTRGEQVAISGEVLRPAIYELKEQATAQDLVQLAGGLKVTAYAKNARIERVDSRGARTVIDLDLQTKKGKGRVLKSGDHLHIGFIKDRKENVVSLLGHVHHPGDKSWALGMRISDLVGGVERLRDQADLDAALLVREKPPVGQLEVLYVHLGAALQSPGASADLVLNARDHLQIFSKHQSREAFLEPLLAMLGQQASSGDLVKTVSINGEVRFPGQYPLTPYMTIAELILAAGGLEQAAYTQVAELSRLDLSDVNRARFETVTLDFTVGLGGAEVGALRPLDQISVRRIPEYREVATVSLSGEVQLPGAYQISRGETLRDVLTRAGGLTEYAFSEAAFFSRKKLREKEREQVERLQADLERTYTAEVIQSTASGRDGVSSGDVQVGAEALKQLDGLQAVGRLVIDLEGILDGSAPDIALADGDLFTVPERRSEVTVVGEVYQPVSISYTPGLSMGDYIDQSGGLKDQADKRAIYVIKASGEVMLGQGKGFFPFGRHKVLIHPGDTIVVPLSTHESIRGIPLLVEASKVIYQLSLGAAAIRSFSN